MSKKIQTAKVKGQKLRPAKHCRVRNVVAGYSLANERGVTLYVDAQTVGTVTEIDGLDAHVRFDGWHCDVKLPISHLEPLDHLTGNHE